MYRHNLLWHLPGLIDLPAWERYYRRYHGPEIVGRFGPWLTRFVGYRAVPVPPEAEKFGYINYRMIEGWWNSAPGWPTDRLTFSPTRGITIPPKPGGVVFLPPQATEDFMGHEVCPDEKTILRWYIVFRYPEGVSLEEGEDWYLNVHAREVMCQRGLTRFFSTRTIPPPGQSLPGWHKPSGAEPPSPKLPNWVRVTEQWYENINNWRKSVIESPPIYTKPSWAKYDKYPFLQPGVDLISTFLLEEPDIDFMKITPFV